MRLNRKRQLWFCPDPDCEQPSWLLLSAGILEQKTSRNSEKMLFFELGKEDHPEEKIAGSVKLITFQGHIEENDEALIKLLKLHGKSVGLIQREMSKNADNNGVFCYATVEVLDDGSGKANEPQSFEICLKCGDETEVKIASSVNGISFI